MARGQPNTNHQKLWTAAPYRLYKTAPAGGGLDVYFTLKVIKLSEKKGQHDLLVFETDVEKDFKTTKIYKR